VTPERNFIFEAEFTKNTGQTTLESGESGNGDQTVAKEGPDF